MTFDFLSYQPPLSAVRAHAIEADAREAARVAAGEPVAIISRGVVVEDPASGLLVAGVQALSLHDDGAIDEGEPVLAYAPSDAERLTAAQDRQRAAIIVARDEAQLAGIDVPGVGLVDASPGALVLITGAVSMASLSLQAGEPFHQTFALLGGGSATLDARATIALGMAVGAGVNALRARADTLTAAVNAATTAEEAAAVQIGKEGA